MVYYPEGVTLEEGDKWLKEEFLPAYTEQDEVIRCLSSKIIKEINSVDIGGIPCLLSRNFLYKDAVKRHLKEQEHRLTLKSILEANSIW